LEAYQVGQEEDREGEGEAAKVSAITATVYILPEPISYACIVSEDELDFEVDELDTE